MNIIRFPKPSALSPQTIAEFKRVCDEMDMILKEAKDQAFLNDLWARLQPLEPQFREPSDSDEI